MCDVCLEKCTRRTQYFSTSACNHRKMCIACAKTFFTLKIKNENEMGFDFACLICMETNNDKNHIKNLLQHYKAYESDLRTILDPSTFKIYTEKMKIYNLMNNSNFQRCIKCNYGFLKTSTSNQESTCPRCKFVFCNKCSKKWQPEHEKQTCEDFTKWLYAQENNLSKNYIQEKAAQCPVCKFNCILIGEGCLHLTCLYCKYEYCADCKNQFLRGNNCNTRICDITGLHAHHPRGCLFYIRDKDVLEIQNLLTINKIGFKTASLTKMCILKVHKSTANDCKPENCNKPVGLNTGGFCSDHYKKYLLDLVSENNLDPLPIFDVKDCIQELRRNKIALPSRGPWDDDNIYCGMCQQVIREQLPLSKKGN